MTSYKCELCNKIFKQKIDYTRHKNKKNPCVSIDKLTKIIAKDENKKCIEGSLQTLFKSCMNIFRDYEAVTGEKALSDFTKLLVLKMLRNINIDNFNYENCNSDIDEKTLLFLFKVCNNLKTIEEEKVENFSTIINGIFEHILPNHSKTKSLFFSYDNVKFNIRKSKTFQSLIKNINAVDFDIISSDIIGNSYESLLRDIMTGKVLGQFFTQPIIKNIMIDIIKPEIFKDGKIESIYDPAMGTGGFLLSSLDYIKKQAAIKDIKINWKYICTEGLGGIEIERDTFQLATSNMFLSSGYICDNLKCGDSIREPTNNKYDIVLANPPFGIKGLKYDDINHHLKDNSIPIKSNSAVPLFLQSIINMLKIKGRCAVVLPDGQEMFSKSNKSLVAVREYLMKTCDLKEIIYLPPGLFTNTSIKTCIAYFHKKREGSDVITLHKSISKTTGKETKRSYKFCDEHQTITVKFYDCNPEKDIKELLVEASIDKIAENKYSLNYTEYIEDESDEDSDEDNEYIVWKTLGEVCDIDYGTRIVKKNNTEGKYPVYGSGRATFTTNTFNRKDYNILVGRFALSSKCVRIVNKHLFLNDSGLSIKPKTNILLHKYIGYYLLSNQNIIYECSRGTAQKNLEMDIFKNIKIPIPSLEQQQEIVKKLDFLFETSTQHTKKTIEYLKEKQKLYIKEMCRGEKTKTLEEVCEFIKSGKYNSKDCQQSGKYPFYNSKASNPSGFIDNFCFDFTEYLILIKDGGGGYAKYGDNIGLGKVFLVEGKSGATSHQVALVLKKNIHLSIKYLYIYLSYVKNDIMDLAHYTTGLGCIKKSDIQNFKIIVPHFSVQQEIVEKCDHIQDLIKSLEKDIEINQDISKQILESYISKKHTQDNVDIVYEDIIIEDSEEE